MLISWPAAPIKISASLRCDKRIRRREDFPEKLAFLKLNCWVYGRGIFMPIQIPVIRIIKLTICSHFICLTSYYLSMAVFRVFGLHPPLLRTLGMKFRIFSFSYYLAIIFHNPAINPFVSHSEKRNFQISN